MLGTSELSIYFSISKVTGPCFLMYLKGYAQTWGTLGRHCALTVN